MSEERRTAPAPATIRRSWWPGLIWSVPLAALAIGVWLLVRFFAQGGTDITITFINANGVKPQDTKVEYLGMEVGSVTAVELAKGGTTVTVRANIQDSASTFLTTGTTFWLRGAKPSLADLSSLSAILAGPTIVMQPGPGTNATHFNGLERQPRVPPQTTPVLFSVRFDGNVGELSVGDAVKLRGFTVGEVEQIGFSYDPTSGTIATPVTLALYPELLHVGEGAGELMAAVGELVTAGLRAKLDRDPPIIGGYRVTLEMVPGAAPASLNTAANLPEIPAAPGGNGLESIATRFNNVPVEQIAQNVLDITHHVDSIVSSPQLKESVTQLDASLRAIHQTVQQIAPALTEVAARLRTTAEQLEQTAAAAGQTLGGATSQTGVQNTVAEIKEAARAVRALADYLDRHPEALIRGRGNE